MITSKAQKTYETAGAPVDLLLYYWKQSPYQPVIKPLLDELSQIILAGPFTKIWLYEHPDKILSVIPKQGFLSGSYAASHHWK